MCNNLKKCLVIFFLCFSVIPAFCAQFALDDSDADGQDKRHDNLPLVRSNVLQHLKTAKGEACFASTLRQYFFSVKNFERDLVKIIVDLRVCGENIVHDFKEKTFSWHEGCYPSFCVVDKKILWSLLDESVWIKTTNAALVLMFSDKGYHLSTLDVSSLKLLKQFMLAGVKGKGKGKRTVFARRKKVWDVVLEERAVKNKEYYTAHPKVNEAIVKHDMDHISKCWLFYKDAMNPWTTDVSIQLRDALMQRKDGMPLEEAEQFVVKERGDGGTDLWLCINELMRTGCAPHLLLQKGRFLWVPQALEVPPRGDLLEDVRCFVLENCLNTEQNATGWLQKKILFSLYRQQHLDVQPYEVIHLLDILEVAGRIPCITAAGERSISEDLQDVRKGLMAQCSLKPHRAGRVQVLQRLEKDNILEKISKEEPVDIRSILRTVGSDTFYDSSDVVPPPAKKPRLLKDDDITPRLQDVWRDDDRAFAHGKSVCHKDLRQRIAEYESKVLEEALSQEQVDIEGLVDSTDFSRHARMYQFCDDMVVFGHNSPLLKEDDARQSLQDLMEEDAQVYVQAEGDFDADLYCITQEQEGLFEDVDLGLGLDLDPDGGGMPYTEGDASPSRVQMGAKAMDDKVMRVWECLKQHHGMGCDAQMLKKNMLTCGYHNNASRDLCCAIAILREQKKQNIVYDVKQKTFTLYSGEHAVQKGCYKRHLWQMLQDPMLGSCKKSEAFMALSNKGLCPVWSCVEDIFELKRLLDADPNDDHVGFILRKRMWEIILQEKDIQSRQYYIEKIGQPISMLQMGMVRRCWVLYNELILDRCVNKRRRYF